MPGEEATSIKYQIFHLTFEPAGSGLEPAIFGFPISQNGRLAFYSFGHPDWLDDSTVEWSTFQSLFQEAPNGAFAMAHECQKDGGVLTNRQLISPTEQVIVYTFLYVWNLTKTTYYLYNARKG